MSIKLFERTYNDEGLIDLEGHLYDLFETVELPKDEWGFRKGTFKIIVEWEDETAPD